MIFLGGFLMARPKTILEKAWQSFGSIEGRLVHEMIGQWGCLGSKQGSRDLFAIIFEKAGAWL